MKQSKRPIWKKSMLSSLSYYDITSWIDEISENGDPFGYDRPTDWYSGEDGYYQDYREQFDELSDGAYRLWEALQESRAEEHWDDMTVALLGYTQKVLGFDSVEQDYFAMIEWQEELAADEAVKRIERLSKRDMIRCFRNVLTTLLLFFDLKAAHDCLTSIVEELDERGAILRQKNNEINRLYEDLTGKNEASFDALIASVPQRMWAE